MQQCYTFLARATYTFDRILLLFVIVLCRELSCVTYGSTCLAVKQLFHDPASKFLSISHKAMASAFYLCQLIILTFCLSFLLPASVLRPLPLIPEIVEFLSPLSMVFPCLDSDYQVMEDDTASDPHNGPKMLLVRVDLDPELKQRLKPAFKQSYGMLNTDAYLYT
jgi:hypothetical protein